MSAADSTVRPVVITRPLAQAEAFAAQVRAIGREPVLLPLLCIAPLADDTALQATLARLSDYALVVFVSPNAIDAVCARLSQWPAGVDIGIVGEGSRQALQRHGIDASNARILAPGPQPRMDSEALFATLDLRRLHGRRVLIVRAQAGRDFLTDMLRLAAVEVDHVVAYARLAPSLDTAICTQLGRLLESQSEWVVTSSEALRHLLELTATAFGNAGVAKIQQKRILVSHPRIAETAQFLGFSSVTICGAGDERLIAALQSPA